MKVKMPRVMSCEDIGCAYNHERKCHALAITIGDGECPRCDTEMLSEKKGGVLNMTGGVGACKIDCCTFNQSLECAAKDITVGVNEGHGECHTFKMR